MADVPKRALNPRVAPRRIARRHPHDELTDLQQDAAPCGSPGIRPLSRNQLTMPPQQGVRRRDCGDLPQGRTTDAVRSGGQPTAIVVRETQPTFTKLTAQKPVLFNQVCDGFPLPPIQPAGQHAERELQRHEVDHEPELTSWLRRPTCGTLRRQELGFESGQHYSNASSF